MDKILMNKEISRQYVGKRNYVDISPWTKTVYNISLMSSEEINKKLCIFVVDK